MRSYPIWNEVTGREYASSRSWGSQGNDRTTVYVGSGPRNSHEFVTHGTRQYTYDAHHTAFEHWVEVPDPADPDKTLRITVARVFMHNKTREFTYAIVNPELFQLEQQLGSAERG
jgi:hypothetical protein